MADYQLLKTIHILSSTLVFGTGLGIFFFMLMANRSGNVEAIRVTARSVVIADWIFTTPAVVVQFVTGVTLMNLLNYPLASTCFIAVAGLFVFVGLLWLPVLWLQLRLKRLAEAVTPGECLPAQYYPLARTWERLGYPAFAAVVLIFLLMVYKPWLV